MFKKTDLFMLKTKKQTLAAKIGLDPHVNNENTLESVSV